MYQQLKVHTEALKAIDSFSLPETFQFGKVLCPVMAICDFKDGKWGPLELLPYQKISLDPTCKVLHYGQEIFEGMKAYQVDGEGPFLFRPLENWNRFNLSAKRMGMATIPEDIFMEAVLGMVDYNRSFIPHLSGESLYLRPFMFATDDHLGIRPSETFKFLVIASPSGAYITSNYVKVHIQREFARACPGGTGQAKTGGNYAGSLKAGIQAQELGLHQTLWLDALHKESIEELSGMNFFAVIDNKLHTPELTETILNGITRRSLITLAKELGHEVVETKMQIKELLTQIQNNSCSECFMCGTASIIVPIAELCETDGEHYQLTYPKGKVAIQLKEALLGIQEGRLEDTEKWVMSLPENNKN